MKTENIEHRTSNIEHRSRSIRETFGKFVVASYARFDLVLERGEGSYVWDIDGGRYLDLAGGTNPVNGSVTIGYNPILLVSSTPPAPPTNVGITVN